MPRRPSPLPTTLAGRAFAVREAHAEGVTPRRLRASDLSRPFHAVRHPGEPTSLADRAAAYAARMPEHERFSHATAAELHGMRMPTGHREPRLHVASLAPQRAPRTAGVAGHQRHDDETQLVTIGEASNVSGLRVSHPVRAWIECGALLSVRQLVVMGDGLVCRRGAVATPAALRRALRAVAGHRGAGRLKAALVDIRSGTDSAMETELRLVLQAAGFPAPEVNGVIRNEHGAIIAHGDLVYRDRRLVVEYDGQYHREERQYFRDIRRLDDVMEQDWRVIRVDKNLLSRRATLLAKVARALTKPPVQPLS